MPLNSTIFIKPQSPNLKQEHMKKILRRGDWRVRGKL